MALRTDQQSFLDTLDANWSAFRVALEDALLAGNDPNTTLADVRAKSDAIHNAHIRLSPNLGWWATATPGGLIDYPTPNSSPANLWGSAVGKSIVPRHSNTSARIPPY